MILLIIAAALLYGAELANAPITNPCLGRAPNLYSQCGVPDELRAREIYQGPVPAVRRFGVDFTSIRTGAQ